MQKYLKSLFVITIASVVLSGCAMEKKNEGSSSLIEVSEDDLIYTTSISPNKEFAEEENIVNYNIEMMTILLL